MPRDERELRALEEALQQEEDTRAALEEILARMAEIERGLSDAHDGLPVSPAELTFEDLVDDPPPAMEMRAAIRSALSSLRSAEQALRAAVEYRPGPRRAGAAHPAPAGAAAPGPPDLDRVDEETHRRLYDHVVQQEFTRQELQPPGDDWVPGYTPEQAGLKIFFLWGRWFATWRKLEVPRDRPEGERREVVRFVLDPGAAGGLRLDGV